jgi:hypothetical protein
MGHRLLNSTSPYLLQHAGNPVDWYEWGDEALARARRQARPIFLSIGYAACHWCHVMAHESFEDPATAAQLNADFVCIKVDREERPDLDSIYMQAVVGLTGSGGWPLSVFLTPDGEPFYGGTYWPPTPRHGLPAFRDILQRVADAWRERRPAVEQAGRAYAQALRDQSDPPAGSLELEPLLSQAVERLFRGYDWGRGGWGGAPKFPQPLAVEFLLTRSRLRGDRLARDQAAHALRCMADGGLQDQIGGGFHRYAVDDTWTVPHFEKMLYDNALLARAYLHAWQLTAEPRFRQVAERSLEFMLRELGHAEGGLCASLDADSEGAEGVFYLWSYPEAQSALAGLAQAEFALEALSITPDGNFEGRCVLRRPPGLMEIAAAHGVPAGEAEAIIDRAAALLFDARRRRPPPARDDKIIAEWNGLGLMALAEAGGATRSPRLRQAAARLADFLAAEMMRGDQVLRTWRDGHAGPPGMLADYAALALGFLAHYQAAFDVGFFHRAERLSGLILSRFGAAQDGLFDTADDHETLITRPRSLQDNPVPSGNALACRLFLVLEALSGEAGWRRAAEQILARVAPVAGQLPTAFAYALTSAEIAGQPPRQLAIAGDPSDPAVEALAQVAWDRFEPGLALAAGTGGQPAILQGRALIGGAPAAYLCSSFSCRLPTTDAAELARLLSAGPGLAGATA